MKKSLIALLVLALAVCCFAFTVSGAEASFKVEITGNTAVSAGDTVKYTVEVKDINVPSSSPDDYDSGLASLTAYVKYDTAFFDATSVTITKPQITNGAWQINADNSNGEITIIAMSDEDSATGKNPTVTENGVLKFEITLKVKADAVEGSGKEIYVAEGTEGGDANLEYVTNVTLTSLDVSLISKLDKPANPVIDKDDNYKAKWNAVNNADSYEIQVFREG